MSAHTPGPWGLDGNLIEGPDGERVACITAYSRRTPKQKANARLIAAAPDLLAALQALVAELDGPGKPYSSDSYAPPQFIETARAAIAKATNRRATFFGGAEHGETK